MAAASDINQLPLLTGPEKFHVLFAASGEPNVSQLAADLQKRRKYEAKLLELDSSDDDIRLAVDKSMCMVIIISGEKFEVDDFLKKVYHVSKRKAVARLMNNKIALVLYVKTAGKNLSNDIKNHLSGCKFESFTDTDTADETICQWLIECYRRQSSVKLAVGDVANGLALSFFYGYLKLVIPGMKDRLRKHGLWQMDHQKRNMALRIFIIITETCYCPPKMSEWDNAIEDGVSWTEFSATRGGCIKRDYKSTIHKLTKDERVLYFVGELATPILSLYDMAHSGTDVCSLTEVEKREQMAQFYYVLSNVINRAGSPYDNSIELVYFDDTGSNPISDILYERIIAGIGEDIQEELGNSTLTRMKQTFDIDETEMKTFKEDDGSTFKKISVDEKSKETFIPSMPYLRQGFINEAMGTYPVSSDRRGIALIISNVNYAHHLPRAGSQTDYESLVSLMTKLRFEVRGHKDLTAAGMTAVLDELVREKNLSDCDVFMCFIMSHGEYGKILGIDDNPENPNGSLKILDILDKFRVCSALRGKPKCFFFPSCQIFKQNDPDQIKWCFGLQTQDESAGNTSSSNISSSYTSSAEPSIEQTETSECDGDPPINEDLNENLNELIPRGEDFLISYGTVPGRKSYRHPQKGTFYVQAFVETMERYSSQMHMLDILQIVTTKVNTMCVSYNKDDEQLQLPYHINMLRHTLYLPFGDVID